MSLRTTASLDKVEENVIPFRFRIDVLPIFVGLSFLIVTFVLYFLCFIQGRWIASMPMLSEIATSFPSSVIFSSVFTMIAFVSLLLMTAVTNWGEIYGVFKSKFVTFSQILSVLCGAFLVVVANCRPDDASWSVYVGTTPFTVLTLIFFTAIFVRSFKSLSFPLKIARGGILICATVTLLFVVLPIPKDWVAHCSTRAACLLAFTSLIVAYFLSFKFELGQLKVDLVVFSDDF
jgi:hypothetical protein